MIRKIDIKNSKRAAEVLQIQLPAYRVEAKLINFSEIPALHETAGSLMKSEEIFFGYFIDEKLAGAVSVSEEQDAVTICRLVVDPLHFRKGIGHALIEYILAYYSHARFLYVSTGEKNEPAVKLYQSFGFRKTDRIEIASGIFLAQFTKEHSPSIPGE